MADSTQYARYTGQVGGSSGPSGDLTAVGTDGITITNGAGAVLGAGTQIAQQVADATHNGYLSLTDWNTFNNKQAALTFGSISTSTTGVSVGSGANSTVGPNVTVNVQTASGSQPGLLSAADWTTFNNKQAAGNYITALTGDATASGPGSAVLTLATVNSNVGSFGSAADAVAFTVNAKGLVTAASAVAIQIAESQVTNLVSDLAGKQPTGNYITALTGDVTASGPGSVAATIANNAVSNAKLAQMAAHTYKGNNTGSTANAADITSTQLTADLNLFTDSLQGLVPASGGGTTNFLRADGTWAVAGAGTVTAVSVASANGLAGTSSGGATPELTLSTTVTGVLKGNGTAISAASASDIPTVLTTTGDMIYSSSGSTAARLPIGSSNQILQVSGGVPTWTSPTALTTAPTVQKFTSGSGTYTTPTNPAPLYIRVRMVGGGGGGSGSGTGTSAGVGGDGGNTTFGSSLLVANGGTGGLDGASNNAGGTGGTASLGSGPIGTAISGADGQGGSQSVASGPNLNGAMGGSSPFGGAGAGPRFSASGLAAKANTGSGGGGGGASNAATVNGGGGGAAGGYVDAIIASPAATYAYAVGAAGTAGTAGTSGADGGAGAAGYIEVTEHYQ